MKSHMAILVILTLSKPDRWLLLRARGELRQWGRRGTAIVVVEVLLTMTGERRARRRGKESQFRKSEHEALFAGIDLVILAINDN
jgi:hypothetical protein